MKITRKIYLVVIKIDNNACYGGIDDIYTVPFDDEEKAIEYLYKEYREYRENFADDGKYYTEEDQQEDYYFHINNGCDYYTGEIRDIEVL